MSAVAGGEVAGGVDDPLLPGVAGLRGERAGRSPISMSRCAAVAVASRGTGGSCDSPPEEMNSTFLSRVARCGRWPRRAPDPLHRGERRGDRVDEDRDERLGGDVAVDDLDRLDGAVVDLHVAATPRVSMPSLDDGLGQRTGRGRRGRRAGRPGCRSRRCSRRRSRCRTAASGGRRSRCSGPGAKLTIRSGSKSWTNRRASANAASSSAGHLRRRARRARSSGLWLMARSASVMALARPARGRGRGRGGSRGGSC